MCSVILNVVKNLKAQSGCVQILRYAQDDKLIANFYFDTPTSSLYSPYAKGDQSQYSSHTTFSLAGIVSLSSG